MSYHWDSFARRWAAGLNSALLIGAILTLLGCAGTPAGPAVPVADTLSGLPAPGEVVKAARAAEVRLLTAADYLDTNPDYFQRVLAEDAVKQVVFFGDCPPSGAHGLDGVAYCMYQFTLPDHGVQPMLRWQWTGAEPAADELWLGLPDVARGVWEWHNGGSERLLDVASWTPYLDGDQLLVAVVIVAQAEYRLDWIKAGPAAVKTQVLLEPQFGVEWTDLKVVGERPAIAYIDQFSHELYFVRANDNYGWSWGTPVLVAGGAYDQCSLALVQGRPAIAYNNSGRLAFARAADPNGATWQPPVEVTTQNDSGNFGSLAMVDGQPATSSLTNWGYDVLYTRATDEVGSNWSPSVNLDTMDNSIGYTSLAVVDGNPAIAYISGTALNGTIRFIRATDAAGTTWGAPVVVTGAGLPEGTCLAVVNGYPAISYIADVKVHFVIANDAQGLNWWAPIEFEEAGAPQWRTSLAVIDGYPAIAYGTWTPDYLYYVSASDMSGSNWHDPQVIDQEGEVGEYPSLCEINGLAGFAYGEDTNFGRKALKYALRVE